MLLLIIIGAFTFILLSDAVYDSNVSLAIKNEDVHSLYGIAISEPVHRGNRNAGYRIKLYAAMDGDKSVFSAKGGVYVISELSDIHFGDYIAISGEFRDNYFKAESTEIIKRNSTGRLRINLISFLDDRIKGSGRGLSSMLLLGSDLDGENNLQEMARKAGLSHVIALSGMHLSILTAAFVKPLSKLAGKRLGLTLGIIFLLGFVYLSGWRASLLRSFIFYILLMLFPLDISFTLSFMLLLIIFPEAISDLGTIFSFVSLSGILILSERVERMLYRLYIPKIFSTGLAASASALALSIPFAYEYFGSYQLLSIITSIPAGILVALYMYMSLIALVIPRMLVAVEILYSLIEKLFQYASRFPLLEDLSGYYILLSSIVILVVMDSLIMRRKRRFVRTI